MKYIPQKGEIRDPQQSIDAVIAEAKRLNSMKIKPEVDGIPFKKYSIKHIITDVPNYRAYKLKHLHTDQNSIFIDGGENTRFKTIHGVDDGLHKLYGIPRIKIKKPDNEAYYEYNLKGKTPEDLVIARFSNDGPSNPEEFLAFFRQQKNDPKKYQHKTTLTEGVSNTANIATSALSSGIASGVNNVSAGIGNVVEAGENVLQSGSSLVKEFVASAKETAGEIVKKVRQPRKKKITIEPITPVVIQGQIPLEPQQLPPIPEPQAEETITPENLEPVLSETTPKKKKRKPRRPIEEEEKKETIDERLQRMEQGQEGFVPHSVEVLEDFFREKLKGNSPVPPQIKQILKEHLGVDEKEVKNKRFGGLKRLFLKKKQDEKYEDFLKEQERGSRKRTGTI